VTTQSFDNGHNVPATEASRPHSLIVECGHRGLESRKGGREHHTSQGRFWFRQHPFDNDQGAFPPLGIHSRLTPPQDSMANKVDYVDLGLACADVCRALERGMDGRRPDELNRSVCEAIEQLTA